MPLLIKLPRPENAPAYPAMLNVLSRRQTAVQRALRRDGLAGYEPMTQATLLALADAAPPGAALYDVGAHIGLYAALLETVFQAKAFRTYAFEPTPEVAGIARSLAHANKLGFSVVETALSDENRTATLYLSDKSESSNSLNVDFRSHEDQIEVSLTTLDAFAGKVHVDPHILKIDVETHEPAVLRGAMRTIERSRPHVVCEILRNGDGDAVRQILHQLSDLGYEFHPLTERFPWPDAQPDDLPVMTGLGARDWLFAPEPVTEEFTASVARWLAAIERCGPETNLLIDPGTPLPREWNAVPEAQMPRRNLLDRMGGRRLARNR